jgi:hypothetical protein
MTAKKLRQIESPIVDVASDSLDPSLLTKRPLLIDSMHLNLRLSGESAHFYRYLEKHTPAITDSLRIRDCVRIAAFLVAMKQDRRTVLLTHEDGSTEDLLDHIGAFLPQTRMDTRRRPAAEKAEARE